MPDKSELSRLFRTLDASAWIDLAAIVVCSILLIVLSQRLLYWIANRVHGGYRFRIFAMIPIARLAILIGAVSLIVPMVIEPSLQNMVALLGAASLAIGFALKDYGSSLIAGVVSAVELPYRPGDWIQVDDAYGEVTHVGIRTVQIVTADDNLVHIPHSKLWNTPIYNANNGGDSLQCVANFYLHPDHDAAQVWEVLRDVALTSAYLKFDKPIAVIVQEQPWGTHYRIRAYPVDPRQQFRFVSDLTVRGKAALRRLSLRFSTLPVTTEDTHSPPS
ncbi:MAG: mechanosensitive ion channel family protein [Planctomycetaceae bacterium]|nr:MAG: mechanosensitive ion channel family protein [Planctomycetaceae bacterium]